MPERPTDERAELPIICDVGAMNPEQRERYRAATRWLRLAVQEIRELDDGYALRLPADACTIRRVVEFMSLERLCCPFLALALEAEPAAGPLWLKLTGRSGAKELLSAELGLTSAPTGLRGPAGK